MEATGSKLLLNTLNNRLRSPSAPILSAWRKSQSIPKTCSSCSYSHRPTHPEQQLRFNSTSSTSNSTSVSQLNNPDSAKDQLKEEENRFKEQEQEPSTSISTSDSPIYPASRANLRPSPNLRAPLFQSAIFKRQSLKSSPSSSPFKSDSKSRNEPHRSQFTPPPPSNLPPLPTQSSDLPTSDSDLIQQALSPQLDHPQIERSKNTKVLPPFEQLLDESEELKKAYDTLEKAGRKGDLHGCLYAASQVRTHLVSFMVFGEVKKVIKGKRKEVQEEVEERARELQVEEVEKLPLSYLLPIYLPLLRLLGSKGQYQLALGVILDMRRAGLGHLIDGNGRPTSLASTSSSSKGSISLEKLSSFIEAKDSSSIRAAILDHLLLAFIKGGSMEGMEFTLLLISNSPSATSSTKLSTELQQSLPACSTSASSSPLSPSLMKNWTSETTSHMIEHCLNTHNLEFALSILGAKTSSVESGSDFVPLSLNARKNLIALALHCRESRIAVELADWFDRSSMQKIEPKIWMDILKGAARCSDLPTIQFTFQRAIQRGLLSMDTGLFLQILSVSSRGDLDPSAYPFLQTVISSFKKSHTLTSLPSEISQAIHLSLFSASSEVFDFKFSFKHFIDLSRISDKSDLEISGGDDGIHGITEPLTRAASFSHEDLETAIKVFKERGRRVGRDGGVDVELLNALIKASNRVNEVKRAFELYEMRSQLWNWKAVSQIKTSKGQDPEKSQPQIPSSSQSLEPNLSTYHSLLRSCLLLSSREKTKSLLSDLNYYGIKINSKTYEIVIQICLDAEDGNWEDSIGFLDEMRGKGLIPTKNTYDMLIRTAAKDGVLDWRELANEMTRDGYFVPGETMKYLFSLGHDVKDYRMK